MIKYESGDSNINTFTLNKHHAKILWELDFDVYVQLPTGDEELVESEEYFSSDEYANCDYKVYCDLSLDELKARLIKYEYGVKVNL